MHLIIKNIRSVLLDHTECPAKNSGTLLDQANGPPSPTTNQMPVEKAIAKWQSVWFANRSSLVEPLCIFNRLWDETLEGHCQSELATPNDLTQHKAAS